MTRVREVVETHMSWVVLTATRAYKLKKPVRLPYVDYSTVERRHRSCENELALGRRLAASVYLEVTPLVATPHGLALDGQGDVVDWLVVMRRLPAELMLPQMLARGEARPADADAVADLLADFYRDTRRASWSAAEYRHYLRTTLVAVGGELVARGASRSIVTALVQAELAALESEAPVFAARIEGGHVVDAHGDLRPEHVCLETPPVVIDPLEFDDDLRTLDAASELAFFALECERIGASWFGECVIARYAARSGDHVPEPLAVFYRALHALTRALLALRHLDDVPPADRPRWRAKAEDYVGRALAGRPYQPAA